MSQADYPEEMEVDDSGNVYVASRFTDTADFGTTNLVAAATRDSALIKLSANGDFLWSRRLSSNAQSAFISAMALDSTGNLHTASWQNSSTAIVSKLNGNGTVSWTKTISSNTSAMVIDMQIKNDGNIYIGGFFRGTADFDPSSKIVNKTSSDMAGYVLNLTSNGGYKWVSTFQSTSVGAGSSAVRSMAIDSSGSILVAGLYDGSVDFNPGAGITTLDTAGGTFAAKLNAAGGLTWVDAFTKAADGFMNVYGVASDSSGNMYIAGIFSGTVDMAPGTDVSLHTSAGNLDSYVIKLNTTGSLLWDDSFGGLGNDVVFAINVDSSGNIHLAGYFEDAVDFNPDPTAQRVLGSSGSKANGFVTRWRRT
ncbi:MAG: hypothetical protein U0892_17165 [Pirellulales bacterium]